MQRLSVPGPVAVAWSGGADSTALLHACVETLGASAVTALHVDHGMRSNSGDDAEFCATTAAAMGVRCDVRRLNLGDATEGIARTARYAALGSMCAALGIGTLFTAHHADDNLETLLLALLRGSGLVGLAGIRARLKLTGITSQSAHADIEVVRPLLDVPRAELLGFLGGRPFRSDPTNLLLDRRRNRVRHEIVPALMAIADGPGPLLGAAGTLRRDRTLIEKLAAGALDAARTETGYSAQGLLAQPELTAHVIRALLRPHLEHPPDAATVARVEAALGRGRGGIFQVRGAELTLRRGVVRVGREQPVAAPAPVTLAVPGQCRWGAWSIGTSWSDGAEGRSQDAEWFDASAVEVPLQIRCPERGERVRWFGGKSSTLRRRLADRAWPPQLRSTVPVITDARGVILLVGGAGRSAAAPLRADGGTALRIHCDVTRTHEDCEGEPGSL